MFKCSCRRMKCDKGSDAWNNLRISHIHVFLKNLGQHVPRKINMEFAKVRRKNFFFGEDGVFQMKEFRTTLKYAKELRIRVGFDGIWLCHVVCVLLRLYLATSVGLAGLQGSNRFFLGMTRMIRAESTLVSLEEGIYHENLRIPTCNEGIMKPNILRSL